MNIDAIAAQEKAKELIEKFLISFGLIDEEKTINFWLKKAKQCALTSIDEILNMEVWEWPHNTPEGKMFYEQVKEEINKL